MQQKVEPAPFLFDRTKHAFERAVGLDIERQEETRIDSGGYRSDMRLGLVVEKGQCELGTRCAERSGASGSDRLVVRDADDQANLAGQ